MTTHHLDLLLAALLCGCACTGALLAAASLALLVFLAGALLATLALAASEARRLGGAAARAVAAYAVVKAAARVVLVARAKAGALASRVRRLEVDDRAASTAWLRALLSAELGVSFLFV